ncbi:hypothetical protein [Mesorhizobium helmanticense]|uniref:hypothetical protein n=1 Tax=Mesorhizobium helmanticense TaxID=1776423 RepID=UPI0011B26AA1|nr:hypothetical protein [Mesorhizobium helmanticense]
MPLIAGPSVEQLIEARRSANDRFNSDRPPPRLPEVAIYRARFLYVERRQHAVIGEFRIAEIQY